MGPAYRLFYDTPLHIVRGDGVWLYDAAGKRYLDMYNNVPHVGHCHPRVVAALQEQAQVLNTHTRYLHDNVVALAERIADKLPAGLDTTMFCCTGSEANELALRIARTATGGSGVIVTSFAYHGSTQATWEISTDCIPPEDLPAHVAQVPAPDCYRGDHRGDDAAQLYAAAVSEAIAELESRDIKPAAFIADTIMSSSGVVAPPPGYLREVATLVRKAGLVFIADEVQPGFGRTGAHFWGFEADAFTPDIVTMGKPMGNGHPVAALVARRDLVDAFAERCGYFNTFGGNPVSAAAGLAVLDVIESEGLQQNALHVGRYLHDGLLELAERHMCIGDVRSRGLFLAVDLVTERETREPATKLTKQIVNGLRERGVLTSAIGPDKNILKLRPPLVLTKQEAGLALNTIDEVLNGLPSS